MTPLASELYALTHRGNRGDAAFYRRVCADATTVLELGSGYGRLLQALTRSGRALVGLELDPHLRRLARTALSGLPPSRRADTNVIAGDMRRFAFTHKFERILLPYNGLYCLLTAQEVLMCLRCIREHLAPNGIFAFDVWNADAFHKLPSDGATHAETDPIMTVAHRDTIWGVFEQSTWNKRKQRLDVLYTYRDLASRRTCKILIAQRYLLLPELKKLVRRAGFKWLHCNGGFRAELGDRTAERFVVQLTVPAAAQNLHSTGARGSGKYAQYVNAAKLTE